MIKTLSETFQKELLRFAQLIPEQNLQQVVLYDHFNSWGVEYRIKGFPNVMVIGTESDDFTAPCYPFMAAHEGLHSISSVGAGMAITDNAYLFLLYNIFEDARINGALLQQFTHLSSSYQATRQVIIMRWTNKPLYFESPLSRLLQYLCYLNHIPAIQKPPAVDRNLLEQLWQVRQQIIAPENQPLINRCINRDVENRIRSNRVVELIQKQKIPSNLNLHDMNLMFRAYGLVPLPELRTFMQGIE